MMLDGLNLNKFMPILEAASEMSTGAIFLTDSDLPRTKAMEKRNQACPCDTPQLL